MKNKFATVINFIERDRRSVALKLLLVALLLFFSSLNFLDRYLAWSMAAIAVFCALSLRRLRFSLFDLVPLLFSLSIVAYGLIADGHLSLQPTVYFVTYFIGANLCSTLPPMSNEQKRRVDTRLVIVFFAVFALGMALHLALNMWVSGEIDVITRISIDYWNGNIVAATLQSALAVFGIGFSVALVFSEAPLWLKPLALVLCALLNIYNLKLGGRTPVLITAIVIVAAYLFMMLFCRRRLLRPVFTVLLIVMVIVAGALYIADFEGVRTAFETSNFYERFFHSDLGISEFVGTLFADMRFVYKLDFIKNFSLSIWGGGHIHELTMNFAHDIFLDGYDAWGIVTFGLLVVYMLLALARVLRLAFDRSVPFAVRQLVFSIELSLFIIFCLEPIWFGAPWLFASFSFVDGVAAYYHRSRAERTAPLDRPLRISFFSSNLNHHMLPLCRSLAARLGEENFRFVSTEPISQARLALGYEDMDAAYPFVLREYAGEDARAEAARLCRESDIVIFGSAPMRYFNMRARSGRPLFLYSERLNKELLYGRFTLRRRLGIFARYASSLLSTKVYLLAASGYAARDFAACGLFWGRAYKWGYFPETDLSLPTEAVVGSKEKRKLIWVGRFTRFKHPERAIEVATLLRDRGYDFELDMIGCGELEDEARRLIDESALADRVNLVGALPHAEIGERMRCASVFLFTSDSSEGWGAVLNEAMGAACAVVTTDAPGSVPYLLRHGENGLVLPDGDVAALADAVGSLLDSPETAARLGLAAAQTVRESWNADVAASRLLALSHAVLPDEAPRAPKLFDSGVASREKAGVKECLRHS